MIQKLIFRLILITYLTVSLIPNLLFGQEQVIQKQPTLNYHRVGVVVMPHTAWQFADFSSAPFGNTQMYTFGFSYERRITKRIGFESDLLYSYYVGHLICDSVIWIDFNTYKCFGSKKENLHFFRIPLIISAPLNKNSKMNIDVMVGIQPGFLLKGLSRIDKTNNYPEFYMAHFMTGFGANYKLSENYSLKGQVRIEMAYVAIALGMLAGVTYNL